ncbi:hypothetical protein Pelo_18043 [Pelomyxa schiedti]|nr:hypothetical protein Pelo_18043 [Pelomyxa schiedti]
MVVDDTSVLPGGGATYTGRVVDGKPDGRGTIKWPSGSTGTMVKPTRESGSMARGMGGVWNTVLMAPGLRGCGGTTTGKGEHGTTTTVWMGGVYFHKVHELTESEESDHLGAQAAAVDNPQAVGSAALKIGPPNTLDHVAVGTF